jgi:hypothetical protein
VAEARAPLLDGLRPWNNFINWTIILVLFAQSLLLAAQVMLPNLFQK